MKGFVVVCRFVVSIIAFVVLTTSSVAADDTLYRYEADDHPLAPGAGWIIGNPCEDPCSEVMDENGHFVYRWDRPADFASYHLWLPGHEEAVSAVWIEWRFRSNHPLGSNFFTCDGRFSVSYGTTSEVLNMYGDAAISFGGNNAVFGLDIEEFHTYRYESRGDQGYRISVNGTVFVVVDLDDDVGGTNFVQVQGVGGCDGFRNTVNEWDFVRYGTISFGEKIIASEPPAGNVDVRSTPDRFAITFDSANYVYIDDITVETTGGGTSVVTQTRRRENDEPDTVEIVLDRPIPFGETTRFIFDDGTITNTIEYTFANGDMDDNGFTERRDHAALIDCLTGPIGSQSQPPCNPVDFTVDGRVDLIDIAFFQQSFTGPKYRFAFPTRR